MRVLLINPYYPISESPSPPLGLAFLAGALERAGIAVRILDFVVTPYSPAVLAEALESFAPALVGATSVTMSFDDAVSIIQEVKKISAQVRTVMGGPMSPFGRRQRWISSRNWILLSAAKAKRPS